MGSLNVGLFLNPFLEPLKDSSGYFVYDLLGSKWVNKGEHIFSCWVLMGHLGPKSVFAPAGLGKYNFPAPAI